MRKTFLSLIVLMSLIIGADNAFAQFGADLGDLGADLTPDVGNITGGNSNINKAVSEANAVK